MKVGKKTYQVAGNRMHTIDAKGRTVVPVQYRQSLGDTFVITLGLDGCLFLYPLQEWQVFADKLQALPPGPEDKEAAAAVPF